MWKRWRNRGGRGGALFLKGKKCPLKYLWGGGVCQWFLIYTIGLKNCEKARVKSCTEITRGNCRNITGHQRNDVASKENFQFEPSSHPFFLLSPFFSFFLSTVFSGKKGNHFLHVLMETRLDVLAFYYECCSVIGCPAHYVFCCR